MICKAKIKRVINYLISPRFYAANLISCPKISRYIPDKIYLKLYYYVNCGSCLDLVSPTKFTQKLNWLKLNYKNPLLTILVDKFLVKQYVIDKIGADYVIPILGVWDRVEDIDWDKLPEQFVIKCNHDSGSILICSDKNRFDFAKSCDKLKSCMENDFSYLAREWPYKYVRRKIIAEQFLIDSKSGENLLDYKFFCFDGIPQFMYIGADRGGNSTSDFFDMDFNHLPFHFKDPNAEVRPSKPQNFDLMVRLAKTLSEGLPHVRVDFYDIDGHVYFGEMTFFHHGGCFPIYPEQYDYEIGKLLRLPQKQKM